MSNGFIEINNKPCVQLHGGLQCIIINFIHNKSNRRLVKTM